MSARRFLFLQGNASRFFDRLGHALAQHGHTVHRINFNGGDWAFWSAPGAIDYRGMLDDWPAFLEAHLDQWKVTDVVLFGDCRPLHRAAIPLAKRRGIEVHVCDEGYLRPNWITVERDGINGHSSLARDIAWYRDAAQVLPQWDGGKPVLNSGARRAIDDILYLAFSLLLSWRYPHYRTHRPHHKLVEYLGGARRFFRLPIARWLLRRDVARIRAGGKPHYVFPLQLEADSQIRFHSGFASISAAIELVVRSFAAHAPPGTLLTITEHPLDTSLTNWRRVVDQVAQAFGVADRVFFLERGTPELLLQDARGVVTVNSTVGYLAMAFGKPVVALGRAIYDLPSLTHQHGLDAFWNDPAAPDPASLDAFRRVVASRTQINGGYFCKQGLALAVDGLLARWARPALALSPIPADVRAAASADVDFVSPAAATPAAAMAPLSSNA